MINECADLGWESWYVRNYIFICDCLFIKISLLIKELLKKNNHTSQQVEPFPQTKTLPPLISILLMRISQFIKRYILFSEI